jgi:hypothetical protein
MVFVSLKALEFGIWRLKAGNTSALDS